MLYIKRLLCLIGVILCIFGFSKTLIKKDFQYGIDVLESSNFLALNKSTNDNFISKNFAIFTHSGAKNSKGQYTLEVILNNKNLHCSKILFPEHGNSFKREEWNRINIDALM